MMKRSKKTLVTIVTAATMLASVFAFSSCDVVSDVLGNIPIIGDLFGKKLESIEVTTKPTKVEYKVGEKFDPKGMVITAKYSDESEAPVEGWTYSPTTAFDKKSSNTKVEISYTEGDVTETATVTVKVTNDVTDLVIKEDATQTSYLVGETFNPTGMVLTATYQSGDKEDITATTDNVTYSKDPLTGKETEVEVSYGGKTAKQAIEFANSLELKTPATKTVYMLGEKFNPAGMVVTASFPSGATRDITVNGSAATYKTGILLATDSVITVSFGDLKVEQPIEFAKGVFIEAEEGLLNGAAPNPATTGNSGNMGTDAGLEQAQAGALALYEAELKAAKMAELGVEASDPAISEYVASDEYKAAVEAYLASEQYVEDTEHYHASGDVYLGGVGQGDTISFLFNSDKAGKGEIAFRLASSWLWADNGNWTPSEMADVQFNLLCEFYVNGVKYNIPDSVILEGGKTADGSFNQILWVNWKEVEFSGISFKAGRNDIELKILEHGLVSPAQTSYNFAANVDSLIITSAECEVSPLALTMTHVATSAKVEEVDGKAYFVVEGDVEWTGYKEDELATVLNGSIAFDFQGDLATGGNNRILNTAADRTVTVNKTADGKGTFKMMVNVSTLVGSYSTHFSDWVTEGADGSMQNFDYLDTANVANETVTIGHGTYTLVYDPTYSTRNNPEIAGDENAALRKEHFYGCVGLIATNNQKLEVTATLGTEIGVENRNGNVYFVVAGGTYDYTAENYNEEELAEALPTALKNYFYFDIQDNPNEGGGSSWTTRLANAHVINLGENKTFELVVDITNVGANALTMHLKENSANTGAAGWNDFKPDVEVFTDEEKLGTMVYEVIYDKSTFFGCVGIRISRDATFTQTAKLAVEDGKVYLVIDSTWDGYTDQEIASMLPEFKDIQVLNAWTNTEAAYAKVVEGENSCSYYIDITSLAVETANPYFVHLVAGDMKITVSTNATDLTATLNGKTYTLSNHDNSSDSWKTGLTIINVTEEAAE